MTNMPCPVCGGETVYKTFSGGREWDCANSDCGADGTYPDGAAPRRAAMLQTPEGFVALRAEMDQELARRHEVAPGTRHGEWTVVQEASPVVIGKDPTTRQQRDTQMWTCRYHCGAVVDISRKYLNSAFRPVCRHGQLPTSMNTGNRKDPDPNE